MVHERSPELAPDLLVALRRGEPEAFPALVDRYGARLQGFAARMCRSDEDAKDVLQDTLLAAARSVSRFRGDATLSTWLFRIAANACRKMRRRGKFEPAQHVSLDEIMSDGVGTGFTRADARDTPETAFFRTDMRSALEEAIAELPPPYRAVLILRELEGLTTEETASALGVSSMAVRLRLHRARLAVRRRLARETAGDGSS